jgi:acetyl-CoA carboxylase biotin carboxyl carrier protein
MDIRKVKKLIELLEESGIAEIEITEGEEAVRISRYPAGASVQVAAPVPFMTPIPQHAAAPPSAGPSSESPATPSPSAEGHQLVSPMVGTYYSASAPGAEPFVKLGDEVQAGDTLCIIEAMKMMNQIEADVSGRVASIEAENGQPVEFGQLLFVID